MSQYFKVGKIVNTQGLKGEVRVISTTDFAENRYQKGVELALFEMVSLKNYLRLKATDAIKILIY